MINKQKLNGILLLLIRTGHFIETYICYYIILIFFQSFEPRDLFPYLVIGQFIPRLFAIGEYFPQDNSITPDIRLHGKRSVQDGLRRHPTDR